MNINLFFKLIILEYHIDLSDYSKNTLTSKLNFTYNAYKPYISLGLYETDKNKIKLLCGWKTDIIRCKYYKVADGLSNSNFIGNSFTFPNPNDFNEKSCYLTKFNSEYLICCAITDFIKCHRINKDFYMTKEFKISHIGNNSYLTIKSNNDYVTLFYMNTNPDIGNFIYDYYIYLPTCKNVSYVIL